MPGQSGDSQSFYHFVWFTNLAKFLAWQHTCEHGAFMIKWAHKPAADHQVQKCYFERPHRYWFRPSSCPASWAMVCWSCRQIFDDFRAQRPRCRRQKWWASFACCHLFDIDMKIVPNLTLIAPDNRTTIEQFGEQKTLRRCTSWSMHLTSNLVNNYNKVLPLDTCISTPLKCPLDINELKSLGGIQQDWSIPIQRSCWRQHKGISNEQPSKRYLLKCCLSL